MPSSHGFRDPDINVNVGHDGSAYFASDGTGEQVANLEVIGEVAPRQISWTVCNRTGHAILIRIHQFKKNGTARCPISGGDFQNCEYDSAVPLADDECRVITTALISTINPADAGLYDYEIFIANAATSDGNAIDPELQMDL